MARDAKIHAGNYGRDVTSEIDELEQLLAMVADLAVTDKVYLPIFMRMERMLEEAKSHQEALARARAMVGQPQSSE